MCMCRAFHTESRVWRSVTRPPWAHRCRDISRDRAVRHGADGTRPSWRGARYLLTYLVLVGSSLNERQFAGVGFSFVGVFRPRHSTTYIGAAYCCRWSEVVCLSVCHNNNNNSPISNVPGAIVTDPEARKQILRRDHDCEPCKNGRTNRDAVWMWSCGLGWALGTMY